MRTLYESHLQFDIIDLHNFDRPHGHQHGREQGETFYSQRPPGFEMLEIPQVLRPRGLARASVEMNAANLAC